MQMKIRSKRLIICGFISGRASVLLEEVFAFYGLEEGIFIGKMPGGVGLI